MSIFKRDKKTGDEILFSCRWIEVRRKDGWFIYTHTPATNSVGVAVLAYRKNSARASIQYEYLGRYETTPSHYAEPKLCAITGGYDKPSETSIVECALDELLEEGGWEAPESAVTELGKVFPSKNSDMVVHLFAVDLDQYGAKQSGESETTEKYGSHVRWVTESDLVHATDPLNHAMLMRLKSNENNRVYKRSQFPN